MIIYANYGTRVFLCVEYHGQIVIITPLSLVLPSKLKEHSQNNEHKDITSIIKLVIFQDFCIIYANYAQIEQITHKLQDN